MLTFTMLPFRLGSLYLDTDPAVPTNTEISVFIAWIDAEYKRISVEIEYTNSDFDLPETIEYFRKFNRLKISTAHNSHPYLTFSQNAKFRSVHDWHHIMGGYDSTLTGEILAYKLARQSAPRTIWWLLHSEIVLQAAACIASGSFQPQKFVNIIGA
jgi:hypothetical protein